MTNKVDVCIVSQGVLWVNFSKCYQTLHDFANEKWVQCSVCVCVKHGGT